jgi:hypothetical protein
MISYPFALVLYIPQKTAHHHIPNAANICDILHAGAVPVPQALRSIIWSISACSSADSVTSRGSRISLRILSMTLSSW